MNCIKYNLLRYLYFVLIFFLQESFTVIDKFLNFHDIIINYIDVLMLRDVIGTTPMLYCVWKAADVNFFFVLTSSELAPIQAKQTDVFIKIFPPALHFLLS